MMRRRRRWFWPLRIILKRKSFFSRREQHSTPFIFPTRSLERAPQPLFHCGSPAMALCSGGGGGNRPTAAAVFVSDACFPHVTDTSRTETDANARYRSIVALLFVVGWSRFGWGNYCFIKIYILFISDVITIIIIIVTTSTTRARCLDTESKTGDVCWLGFIIFLFENSRSSQVHDAIFQDSMM